MCGCCSLAAISTSRLKRSTLSPSSNSGASTFTTTRRSSDLLLRQVGARHAAATELGLECVDAGERLFEAGAEGVSYSGARGACTENVRLGTVPALEAAD